MKKKQGETSDWVVTHTSKADTDTKYKNNEQYNTQKKK
jgi:hypothetical protein